MRLPFRKDVKKKLGVALGGGAARAMAHIGVLKVLDEEGIRVDYVAGTSGGSIVGALYAAGFDITRIHNLALRLRWNHFAHFRLSRMGLISSEAIERFVTRHIGQMTIAELKVPFCAVATDILTGHPLILKEGDVAKAVRASCSFPGIYTPTEYQEHLLVDGGIHQNVPVEVVREMGADVVLAVDVIPNIHLKDLPKNVFLLLDRTVDLILKKINMMHRTSADIYLEPIIENVTDFDLDKVKRLVELGTEAARSALPQLKAALH